MNQLTEHAKEIMPVGIVNGSVFAVVTLTDFESVLKIILLLMSIIYTYVKISQAMKRNNSDEGK